MVHMSGLCITCAPPNLFGPRKLPSFFGGEARGQEPDEEEDVTFSRRLWERRRGRVRPPASQ